MSEKTDNELFWKAIRNRQAIQELIMEFEHTASWSRDKTQVRLANAELEVLYRDLYAVNAEVGRLLNKHRNRHLPWYKRLFKK